jgi:NTE family protein
VVRGLVLGGGGVTGAAWMTGLIAGLADAGVDLSRPDIVVGTSAGSVVGAQLGSGATLEQLYARQLEPPVGEIAAPLNRRVLLGYARAFVRAHGDLELLGRRLGAMSLAAQRRGGVLSQAERTEVVRRRLGPAGWPDFELRVTVVDARTGALRVITRADAVPVLDAVVASTAVPGVFAPVRIDGTDYVDGGARTGANADQAHGATAVVALTPMGGSVPRMLRAEPQLQRLGVPFVVVSPDAGARRAIGPNVLEPAARAGSARAGRAQAAAEAERIAAVWPRP